MVVVPQICNHLWQFNTKS